MTYVDRGELPSTLTEVEQEFEELYPVARFYLVPVRRLFPIWRYQPVRWGADDLPDAWAWGPDRYSYRRFDSAAAARAWRATQG